MVVLIEEKEPTGGGGGRGGLRDILVKNINRFIVVVVAFIICVLAAK